MNDRLYELENLVMKEVGSVIDAGCIKPDEWKNLYYAADIIKDIATIESMQNFDNNQSSNYYPDERQMSRNSMGRIPMNTPIRSYENSYNGDMVDSRGSRDSYNGRSNDNEHAIHVLEDKLNKTNDPTMRDHLMKTIEMMKYER